MAQSKLVKESAERGRKDRAAFLEAFAADPKRDPKQLASELGHYDGWLTLTARNWRDFGAQVEAIRRGARYYPEPVDGENKPGPHSREWDGTFSGFRAVFLNRESPWFHERMCTLREGQEDGEVGLIILPPEHGKTSLVGDLVTYDICQDPDDSRNTFGHGQLNEAKLFVDQVRARLEPNVPEYGYLRERFGPFAPDKGKNHAGQQQAWTRDGFNVYKRRMGTELDYNLSPLGIDSKIAGRRARRLYIDDPQESKTLNQTDTIERRVRDDWLPRAGARGKSLVTMNVVGDDDIGERLFRSDDCAFSLILPAFNANWADPTSDEYLGPRECLQDDGETTVWEPSPWLWPERYSAKDYGKMKRLAGKEGWARKYMQDWRPGDLRNFTQDDIDRCRNGLRSLRHDPPRHPAGREAEVACAIDPSFARTAVGATAWEPTRMIALDSYARTNLQTWGQMVDMLADEILHWHRPGISQVRWVIVETKGMQAGLATDDRLLELQGQIGFEIIKQETGWDKHDLDFGVTMMARSMQRGEIDFPAAEPDDDERFAALYGEMLSWRPNVRGNKLQQDELMTLWFQWSRWHRLRRSSIRRGSDATNFGFRPLPGMTPNAPVIGGSNWNFGGGITLPRVGRQ